MPNLISVLNRTEGLNGSSVYGEEGKGKKEGEKDEGLDWATIWVFACGAECIDEKSREKEAWREERVMIEWEESV